MVISKLSDQTCAEESTASALLMERGNSFVDGCVDFKGDPAHRSSSGGWRSAWFIIAVEMTERFAYYGIASNLIMYLTGPLGQSTAVAAENVNIWSGTATLLPLLGGFIADSFLGRYRTIIVASLIYILGLGLLTLSAVLTSADISGCLNTKFAISCYPPWFLVILFFISLYLVALGVGGHKSCAQTFGADQFDGQDPMESKARNSFFNWWYFGLAMGAFITSTVTVYIQENFSWTLGFGIPFIVMLAELLIFLIGSSTYRYSSKTDEKNPFKKIGQVFVKATKNWQTIPSSNGSDDGSYEFHQCSGEFRFLNKALLAPDGCSMEEETISAKDVQETKALLRLTPIWFTSLTYAIVFAQTSTFFTKQGATMDRTIFAGIKIPAASLQSVTGLVLIVFLPIYDGIFVPIARALTGKPSGITMLQRIAAGMVFSALSMVAAALVEMKRLETAEKYGLVDMPNVTVPMSIWWLVPQYILCGIADVFTIVGLQEFFYDQMPKELRSVGLALFHSAIGVGSFLSSFLVSIIDEATSGDERESWFADNLNRAHIDYFYWLLAGLNALGFIAYFTFARSYIYNNNGNMA